MDRVDADERKELLIAYVVEWRGDVDEKEGFVVESAKTEGADVVDIEGKDHHQSLETSAEEDEEWRIVVTTEMAVNDDDGVAEKGEEVSGFLTVAHVAGGADRHPRDIEGLTDRSDGKIQYNQKRCPEKHAGVVIGSYCDGFAPIDRGSPELIHQILPGEKAERITDQHQPINNKLQSDELVGQIKVIVHRLREETSINERRICASQHMSIGECEVVFSLETCTTIDLNRTMKPCAGIDPVDGDGKTHCGVERPHTPIPEKNENPDSVEHKVDDCNV